MVKRKLFKNLVKEISYEWLYNYYIVENHYRHEVAAYLNVSDSTVKKLLKHYNIKKDLSLSLINQHKTMINRYGVATYSQCEDWLVKTKQTNNLKFGYDWYQQTDEFNEKLIETIINKYESIENYRKEIQTKSRLTKFERYNDSNFNNREKSVITCLNKYGYEYFVQSEKFKEAYKITSLNNWGATHYLKTEDGKKIFEQYIFDKYGVKNVLELYRGSRVLYNYEGILFNSKPELSVWIYFTDNNINIIREPIVFEYSYCGVSHNYYPDFEINNKLIEVKGDHFFKEDGTMCNPYDHSQDKLYEAKHQCGLSNGVEFWKSNQYGKYVDYVISTYGKNYLDGFRVK